MRDFEKRFRAREEEFNRDWKQARQLVWVGLVINFAIAGFAIWVVIMLLRFFGVI